MIVKNDTHCFACGVDNPIGLKLKFTPIPNGVETFFTTSDLYQGFQNIIHGGIVATLLDEAIAWACRICGVDAVTGELTVRYKRPMIANQCVKIIGMIDKNKGKILYGSAQIIDQDGNLIATANAKMIPANQ